MTRYAYCPPGSVGYKLATKPNRTQKAANALEFERAINGLLAILGAEVQRDGSPDPYTLAMGLRWRLQTAYGPLEIGVRGVNVHARFLEKITDPATRLRLRLPQHSDKWNEYGFDFRDGEVSLEAAVRFHRRRLESVIDGTA